VSTVHPLGMTRVRRRIDAPRTRVYRTMLDPSTLAQWKVPDGMSLRVHEFEPREGGRIHISLVYDSPTETGKSSEGTDSYHGRFVRLVPDRLIVEVDEFETADPALRGEMTSTIELFDIGDATDVVATHENLPPAISLADNEIGWRMALDKLAALVSRP